MKKALISVLAFLVVSSARDLAAQTTPPPAPPQTPPPAQTQPTDTWWTDRVYVNFNGGFESTSGDLNDATTFRLYDEDANLSVAQSVDSGGLFDFSAGLRVWRNATVGIGFHQGATHSEAAIQGSVPHPLFFNRNRPVALSVGDLKRTERAVHLQLGYRLPVTDKVMVHVMLGPSFFKVRQNVVSAISVAEQGGNFSTVNVTPTITERTDNPTGFNVGIDLGYQLLEANPLKIGAGMFIRYAGASSDIQILSNTVDSDLGGLQVGFGARLRF